MTHYIVQTATAQMPSKVRHPYIRVAVLEVNDDITRVSMISARAHGVKRIVETWERRCVGSTPRSASARAIAEAEALAQRLNERGVE